jgi:UDP-N-acetylglucosamine--N-acetylmuramyl-(pentapeptide) pyrophosphoryl-undecaprenol N-acetylglucosamine transferase
VVERPEHIEPALAVARQWKVSHPNDELIFLGTSSGLENSIVPAANFKLHLIPRVRISRQALYFMDSHPI